MRVAVILYNLGGPAKVEDVRSFLFNIFNDPMIIALPRPLRWLLAKLISGRRAPIAREIYQQIGGRSPLLENTRAQATALDGVLKSQGEHEYKIFVAMRYWHPMVDEVARAVMSFAPEQVVLLPLYPQFSTTTVGSFMRVWRRAGKDAGLDRSTKSVCCYPTEPGFVADLAAGARAALAEVDPAVGVRVLFSAHGLPKKIVARGDPYQWQVEQTARAVVEKLAIAELDWRCCYQSRVGPAAWIGPATDEEIRRAGADGLAVVVVPLSFVSEHSETLVELDVEYRALAKAAGVVSYHRVPTVGTANQFIAGLARSISVALSAARSPCSGGGGCLCPDRWAQCACRAGGGR